MRITAKGQVTIPVAIREHLGLLPNTEIDFSVSGNSVRIVKSRRNGRASRGQRLVGALRGHRGVGLTTDEIMNLTRRS
jgi:AbrB family looped-hinge helix DNA binding protein